VNLETGDFNEPAFDYENDLYSKAIKKKSLDVKLRNCSLCPGLNIKRCTEVCPGWGNLNAKVFFIGQSAHRPAVLSDLPFIIGCGYAIDAALRLSGLLRRDVFITNVVHCHPGKNRASTDDEKKNCLPFLQEEIDIVQPELIIALGNDAQWAFEQIRGQGGKWAAHKPLNIKHPASFMYSAPEERVGWIVKLSQEIDKVYK